jgi:hypothetical protein
MQYLFIDYPLRKRIPMPENYLSRKRKTPTLPVPYPTVVPERHHAPSR